MIPEELRQLKQWVVWDQAGSRKLPLKVSDLKPASSTDPSTWDTFYEASLRASLDGHGLGFVFSRDDPYVGIDLDDCAIYEGCLRRMTPEAAEIIKASEGTYAEWSPSGTGVHIIARSPGLPSGIRQGSVEVYTWGRYFTFTGDQISESSVIKEASPSLLHLVGATRKPVCRIQTAGPCDRPDNAVERATMYTEAVPGAVSGQQGHDRTFALCMKLAIDFALTESEIWDVLSDWNQRCVPPWSNGELQHKIDAAVRRAAGVPTGSAYGEEVTDLEVSGMLAHASRKTDPFPDHLLEVPGALRAFMDWSLSQNHRRNAVLSLLGAIGWMCHLTGRRVQDDTGTRTNLYIIGIAPSSGGKQAPLECIKMLTDAGCAPDSVIGRVTSDAAIAQQLVSEPSSLCLWDEFGLFLQKTGGRNGSLSSVQDVLLELWGASRTNWRAKKYADNVKDQKVAQPVFSVLGMTTPDHFWAGLSRMHLRDGFAGRLLVVDSGPRAERGAVRIGEAPEGLVRFERRWTTASSGNLSDHGLAVPTIPIAEVTGEAVEIFESLLDRIDEEDDEDRASIWGRAIEKARKLALIYACSTVYPGRPVVVDARAAEWGTQFSKWATESFITRAFERVTAGEGVHGTVTREVMKEIQRTGSSDKKALLNATGADAKLLGQVLSTLIEAGRIRPIKSGRSALYVLI